MNLLGFGGVDSTQEAVDHQLPGHRVLSREPGAPLQLVRDDSRVHAPRADLGKVLMQVENALGLAIDGAEHLDLVPRPADYVAEYERVRREAFKVCESLANWSGYYRDAVAAQGVDLSALQDQLAGLFDVTTRLSQENKKLGTKASKGARKNTALRLAAQSLQNIFRRNYCGPGGGIKSRGAFRALSEQERRETEFVLVALRDARAIPASYSRQKVRRLLIDKRTQPPEQ